MVGVRRFLGRRYGWKSIGGIPSTRYNPSFHLDLAEIVKEYESVNKKQMTQHLGGNGADEGVGETIIKSKKRNGGDNENITNNRKKKKKNSNYDKSESDSSEMIDENEPTQRSRHIDYQSFAIQDWRANGCWRMETHCAWTQ